MTYCLQTLIKTTDQSQACLSDEKVLSVQNKTNSENGRVYVNVAAKCNVSFERLQTFFTEHHGVHHSFKFRINITDICSAWR